MRDHFVRLYQHVEWADARALQSLRSASHRQKRDLQLYAHILGSEHTWLSRINGVAPTVAVWPELTLDECETLGQQNISAFNTLIARLTRELLRSAVTYRNSAGDEFTSTIEDILTHVSLHGAYHRGQIAASIRASGDTPSPTDYIAFVRGSPAAIRQS
ncbi:MAG: DinB family protein [Gemmatimonadaceae bacterium]